MYDSENAKSSQQTPAVQRHGLLLSNNPDLARLFGATVSGTEGTLRIRNSNESFSSELSCRSVNWIAIDLNEENASRRRLFRDVAHEVEKIAILPATDETPDTLFPHAGNFTIVPPTISIDHLREILHLTCNSVHSMSSVDRPVVIIGDRESVFADKLIDHLKQQGFHVVLANSQWEVVQLTRSLKPVAVVVGVNVYSMSGQDVCRAIKRLGLEFDPAVYITGEFASQDIIVSTVSAGAEAFISTPYDPVDFIRRIETKYVLQIGKVK